MRRVRAPRLFCAAARRSRAAGRSSLSALRRAQTAEAPLSACYISAEISNISNVSLGPRSGRQPLLQYAAGLVADVTSSMNDVATRTRERAEPPVWASEQGGEQVERGGFDYECIPPGFYDHVHFRARGAQSKWHRLKFARVAREVAGGGRLLDIGCGPGTFLGSLGHDRECVGVDISRNQIAYAQQRYASRNRSFHRCRVGDLPLSEGLFDFVTAIELIEHLSPEEVKETLEAAVARLQPGGKLVLTTPNFGGAWPIVEAMLNRFGALDYKLQHTNKFTRSSLAVLMTMLGLEATKVETYLSVAPFTAVLGWGVADKVAEFERRHTEGRLGFLLIGTGIKPH
jgi:2-polyprenyl-3-methyl-5-hydroxy-6-metoxy-1,4-benzoquinol methylase